MLRRSSHRIAASARRSNCFCAPTNGSSPLGPNREFRLTGGVSHLGPESAGSPNRSRGHADKRAVSRGRRNTSLVRLCRGGRCGAWRLREVDAGGDRSRRSTGSSPTAAARVTGPHADYSCTNASNFDRDIGGGTRVTQRRGQADRPSLHRKKSTGRARVTARLRRGVAGVPAGVAGANEVVGTGSRASGWRSPRVSGRA
jgi:hypothetical protein